MIVLTRSTLLPRTCLCTLYLLYTKLNKKLDNLIHYTHRDYKSRDITNNQNRVINLTKVKFTGEQLKTLNLDPQFAIEKEPRHYINQLIVDTNNAIKHLNSNIRTPSDIWPPKKSKK